MKKEIEEAVRASRIIAIIRNFPPETCLKLAEAYEAGGIRLVEVAFNPKHPESWKETARSIRTIRDRFEGAIHVGAGTVLTVEQLLMMEDAGGEYMVAPNVDPALIRECARRDLAAIPGALTSTEAIMAHKEGASFVKVFPAGVLGPGYVKALTTPLPHISMLAVGGISAENVGAFIKAGCVGAGVGGNLANSEWVASCEWGKISAVARELTARSKE